MRPANCNMKQLTHLESKKKRNPFVQYITNRLKKALFYLCLLNLYLSSVKLSVENEYFHFVLVKEKTKVYGSVILYRGWEQLEVTCNPIVHHNHNLWNVEGHENDRGNNIFNIYQVSAL